MSLTAEQIETNWNIFNKIAQKYLEDNLRKELVLNMFKELEDILAFSPLSTRESQVGCYPGGYIEYVNRTFMVAFKLKELWASFDKNINFTDEELAFSVLMHDLGKVTDGTRAAYIQSDNAWRKKNLGEIYTYNDELDFMLLQDRSLFVLQNKGIRCSINEFVSIRVHDGIYEDSNKAYFKHYTEDIIFSSQLPHILNQASTTAYTLLRRGKNGA